MADTATLIRPDSFEYSMRLTLPWYLPFGLLVGWFGCRAAHHLWKDKRKWKDVVFMVLLSLFPLMIWIFIQFFPQE